jgi:RNA polymerase sigma-70 factor, ECF subfamily
VDRSHWSAYVIARAHWLAIELSYEAFRDHVAAFAPDLGERELETFAPDLFLACACLNGNAAALGVLEYSLLPQAAQAIAQVSAEPEFVQHSIETLRQRLLDEPEPQLTRYRGQGTLAVWVSVVATGIALEQFGGRAVQDGPLALAMQYLGHEVGSDLAAQHATMGPALVQAVQAALQALSARDRNILRLHLSGQCSIGQIGRAYGVHRATAARWLAEIRTSVKQQVAATKSNEPPADALEKAPFSAQSRPDGDSPSSNPVGAR